MVPSEGQRAGESVEGPRGLRRAEGTAWGVAALQAGMFVMSFPKRNRGEEDSALRKAAASRTREERVSSGGRPSTAGVKVWGQ